MAFVAQTGDAFLFSNSNLMYTLVKSIQNIKQKCVKLCCKRNVNTVVEITFP